MSTDTQRAAREMRRLHERNGYGWRHDHLTRENPSDWLAPDERSWRNVWRSFRWAELWTALAAFAWLFGMWIAWNL